MSESTSDPPEYQVHPPGRHAEASRVTLLEEQLNSIDKGKPRPKADSPSQESKRIKLSAVSDSAKPCNPFLQIVSRQQDILNSLSEKRIGITNIRFTHNGLQESGGKSDVILATLIATVEGRKELRNVAVKKLRPSGDVDDERFLRVSRLVCQLRFQSH